MKNLMQNISFKESDGKLAEMFGDKAQNIADELNKDYIYKYNKKLGKEEKKEQKTSITQFRKFYERVLELLSKATEKDFDIKTKPFIKMLNSKVAYARSRENIGENFVALMNQSIDKVNSYEELKNFKYLLESIIGYMPKK
jgi:CRISPR-associated protein Csm2